MTKVPMILVVEDDDWLAQQQVRTLRDGGFVAEYVSHALAAIETIDTRRPDAIVLDVFLIGPNAFTLLHELQSHADLSGIPIVLCTNSADTIASTDLSAYGVRIVLDKAVITPGDLIAAVKKVLP